MPRAQVAMSTIQQAVILAKQALRKAKLKIPILVKIAEKFPYLHPSLEWMSSLYGWLAKKWSNNTGNTSNTEGKILNRKWNIKYFIK
jgi:hypothetical protein